MELRRFAGRTALTAALCLALFPRGAAAENAPQAPPTTVALATIPSAPPAPNAPLAPLATRPAQPALPVKKESTLDAVAKATHEWFQRLKIRGYTQIRYNRLGETNEKLVNTQGDRSIGEDGGFLIRRARLIVYGDVHDHVYVYLQPDFASTAADQPHVSMLRDWYADISIDKKKEFRFRVGQSKVPYGFENMQSSQNRAPFDRSDALNSAVKDERDLGVFFYYAPAHIRKRFRHLVDSGLKGSGDYGVVALGVYNGQTANQTEKNSTPHVVARATWPFQIGKQIVEVGGGGYFGKFVVKHDEDVSAPDELRDVRAHASFILYPQPFGLQVEYNIGRGPELVGDRVTERPLHGGYAMAMVKLGDFIPYVRAVRYDGGRKFETNAPHYKTREIELGLEYKPIDALEFTAAYTFAERTYPKAPYPQESGRFLRLQAQINF